METGHERLKKLTSGLSKTSAKVTASLSSLLGRPAIDAASIEEVEDALIAGRPREQGGGTSCRRRAATSSMVK